MAKKITKKELDLMQVANIDLKLDTLETLFNLRMSPTNKKKIFTKIKELKSSVQELQNSLSK